MRLNFDLMKYEPVGRSVLLESKDNVGIVFDSKNRYKFVLRLDYYEVDR